MGYTQTTFIFAFLPLSILVYLALYVMTGKSLKVCNTVLVCEGLLFYWLAEPKLLLFFVSLSLLMYALGIGIYKAETKHEKKVLVTFSCVFFSFIPVIYRYLPSVELFTKDSQPVTMPLFSVLLVPLGISFFILGSISYIVDIYKGIAIPGNLMNSLVYTMLFPKAICGPVVLWRDFLFQLYEREISARKISEGAKRLIIGYAKKAILGDAFAAQIVLIESKMAVNIVDSASVWVLVILYFFRIYCDFSGYSDIAIGLCRIFGFDIGENFEWPYLSGSVTEFWRRWHISLGRWFKEYVYIPMGGSRKGNLYFNIFFTFIIAALWHGWRPNLILWGVLNGMIVLAEKKLSSNNHLNKAPRFIGIITTVFIVSFGWILFMSSDLTAVGAVFKSLTVSPGGEIPNFTWRFFLTKRIAIFLVIAAAGAFGVFNKIGELIKEKINLSIYDITEKMMLLVLFAIDIMFILGTSYTPFVYSLIP